MAEEPGDGSKVPAEPRGGVSSFHAWWMDIPPGDPIVEVAATVVVEQAPAVPRLYFWALQASFADERRSWGAAHLGLQWNPRHAGATAVNWGGYADTGNVNSILTGTGSPLPSTPDDPNTRDYPWRPGTPYRLRIYRADDGWAGSITDLAAGREVEVRRLHAPGDRLQSPVMWAEVFAGCRNPPTAVRWSGLTVVDAAGRVATPRRLRLSFPSGGDCPNTDIAVGEDEVRLLTNAGRSHRDGSVVPAPSGPRLG